MDAVAQTADLAVGATSFLASSEAASKALHSALLLKSLPLNTLISGDVGVGKTTLAHSIVEHAPTVRASNFDETLNAIENNSTLILKHIEKSANLPLLLDTIQSSNTRVIATTLEAKIATQLSSYFSLNINLPPLQERPEDVELLSEQFGFEASEMFGNTVDITATMTEPDLSRNAYSLRNQIYSLYLFNEIDEKMIMQILQKYIYDRLGSGDDYREFLHLYETPLIKAGLKRFGSQLRLSEELGLNRNTLRKKILQHNIKV